MSEEKESPPRRSAVDWLIDPDHRVMRVFQFIVAFGAVLGVVFVIYDRIVPKAAEPAPTIIVQQGGSGAESTAPRDDPSTLDRVAELEDGVQVSGFSEILGEPRSREQLRNGILRTEWRFTEAVVLAFSDSLDEVIAYTVTAMSPDFTLAIPYTTGGLRLASSSFADTTDAPVGVSGIYPLNARWSYEELHGGGYATEYREVVLAAGFTSTASDEAGALAIPELADCLAYSVWEEAEGCAPEQLAPLRAMRITSMTIGEPESLRAVEQAGGSYFAE